MFISFNIIDHFCSDEKDYLLYHNAWASIAWTSIIPGLEGFLQFLRKKGYLQKLKNNSFQHNFGTVKGEKLTDTILEEEMFIENKQNRSFEFQQFWGCGTKSLFGQIWVEDTKMCIT